MLQNSRAHGFWENAMWEVAEQVSADAAPQPGSSQVVILQYTVLLVSRSTANILDQHKANDANHTLNCLRCTYTCVVSSGEYHAGGSSAEGHAAA